ncbi:hypothetical protein [Streptomyces sp. CBMA370]|uniref:hypothetical protein n=1 Tax=Streptomyces sp. CBMA370 TaxID=1930278 RepID=UPI00166196FB|nr:hypothetical protein [Streptomyces sp. CBMA370]MBD0716063.1 hypothetical protein [Streptomyces sp. CBMA370]
MGPTEDTAGIVSLGEVACRWQADEIRPEDLPMFAADALAAGLDTPALCELAGWPRHADPRDVRDTFESALAEAGIGLPDRRLARRHSLHRMAARLVAGTMAPSEPVGADWAETEAETPAEQAFVALIPACACCLAYTVGLDRRTWATRLREAALALASGPPIGPGC